MVLPPPMQPGPFQTYLIAQSLHNGWRRTLPVVLAPLLSDGPIIAIVLMALSRVPSWWLQVLRFVGGAFVLYLATGALRAARDFDTRRAVPSLPQQGVFRAALVNLLNPAPYVYWSLVTGPLLLTAWQEAPVKGLGLLVGFYVTMLVSWLAYFCFAPVPAIGDQDQSGHVGAVRVGVGRFGLCQIWSGLAVWWQGG